LAGVVLEDLEEVIVEVLAALVDLGETVMIDAILEEMIEKNQDSVEVLAALVDLGETVMIDAILEEMIEKNQDSVEVLEDAMTEKNQDIHVMTDASPKSREMSEEALQNDNHTDVAGKSFLDC
jgi:cupin superfamily acireductone dioxygenase involved in methionine salvage